MAIAAHPAIAISESLDQFTRDRGAYAGRTWVDMG
jgi:hypothetical protein